MGKGEYVLFNDKGVVVERTCYKQGIKDGLRSLYYDTGELLEEQYYKFGQLTDVKSFRKDGRIDYHRTVPVFYLSKDTLHVGEEVILFVRLCNADPDRFKTGSLLITSGFDDDEDLLDTLAVVESSDNNYRYQFKTTQPGLNHVVGRLVYVISVDTATAVYKGSITHPFFVRD